MNRIFRVIFNRSLGVWQAVSEIGKQNGKGKRTRRAKAAQVASAAILALSGALVTAPAMAADVTIDSEGTGAALSVGKITATSTSDGDAHFATKIEGRDATNAGTYTLTIDDENRTGTTATASDTEAVENLVITLNGSTSGDPAVKIVLEVFGGEIATTGGIRDAGEGDPALVLNNNGQTSLTFENNDRVRVSTVDGSDASSAIVATASDSGSLTISNTGTISADETITSGTLSAILFNTTSTGAGNLTNSSGSITSRIRNATDDASAIAFNADTRFNGTVTNAATMTASAASGADNVQVTAKTIFVNESDSLSTLTISNSGTLNAEADARSSDSTDPAYAAFASGIDVHQADTLNITNTHAINVSSSTSSSVGSYGDVYGYGIVVGDVFESDYTKNGAGNLTITNSGTGMIDVTVTDNGGQAFGIAAYDSDDITIENSETIETKVIGDGSVNKGIYVENTDYVTVDQKELLTQSSYGNNTNTYAIHIAEAGSAVVLTSTDSMTRITVTEQEINTVRGVWIEEAGDVGTARIDHKGTLDVLVNAQSDSSTTNIRGLSIQDMENATFLLHDTSLVSIDGESRMGTMDIKAVQMDANIARVVSEGEIRIRAEGSELDVEAFSLDKLNFSFDPDLFSFENSGKVTVSATLLDSQTSQVKGVDIGGFNNATVENSGTISVDLTLDSGAETLVEVYGVQLREFEKLAFVNSANNIDNAQSDKGILVNVDLVNGSTVGSSSTIAAVYVDPNSNTWSGPFLGVAPLQNAGLIEATVNGELDAQAYALYGEDYTGHIDTQDVFSNFGVNESEGWFGELRGNIQWQGTLNNEGRIELPANATAYVAEFDNKEWGVLAINVDNANTYSMLQTETATFEKGSILEVNVTDAMALATNTASGSELTDVITASNSIEFVGSDYADEGLLKAYIETEQLAVEDYSALLDFKAFYERDAEDAAITSIGLEIVKAKTVANSARDGGADVNGRAAAAALDGLNGNSPVYNPLMRAMNSLLTDADVAAASEKLAPQVNVAVNQTATTIANTVQSIIGQRQAVMAVGLNAGEAAQSSAYWIKPFATEGEQGAKNDIAGFDVTSKGVALGMDTEYAPGSRFGYAFTATEAQVDSASVNQTADVKAYTASVYGSVKHKNGVNFDYQASYTHQGNETSRVVDIDSNQIVNDVAKAEFLTRSISLEGQWSKDMAFTERFALQPYVNASARFFKTQGYTEQGSEGGLAVDQLDTAEFVVGIGSSLRYVLEPKDFDSLAVIGNLGLGYVAKEADASVEAQFAGQPGTVFEAAGVDNGKLRMDIGLGLEGKVTETSRLNVMLNHHQQGEFTNSTVSARYELKF